MAITYQHRIKGHTVSVKEPDELADELAAVERRGRSLDPKRVVLAKKRRERLIVKMNQAWKWQRTDSTETATAGQPDRSEPKDADVRAWAAAEGIEVPARGKLSAEVVERYKAAHGG